jgi:hypothetical protein
MECGPPSSITFEIESLIENNQDYNAMLAPSSIAFYIESLIESSKDSNEMWTPPPYHLIPYSKQ